LHLLFPSKTGSQMETTKASILNIILECSKFRLENRWHSSIDWRGLGCRNSFHSCSTQGVGIAYLWILDEDWWVMGELSDQR
jgi:hypothetical protein